MNPPHANAVDRADRMELRSPAPGRRPASRVQSVDPDPRARQRAPTRSRLVGPEGLLQDPARRPRTSSSSSRSPTPACARIGARSPNFTPRPASATTGSSTSRADASRSAATRVGSTYPRHHDLHLGQEVHPLAFPDVSLARLPALPRLIDRPRDPPDADRQPAALVDRAGLRPRPGGRAGRRDPRVRLSRRASNSRRT